MVWFKQRTVIKMVSKHQSEIFNGYIENIQKETRRALKGKAKQEARTEERANVMGLMRTLFKEEVAKMVGHNGKGRKNYAEEAKSLSLPKGKGVSGSIFPTLNVICLDMNNGE